MTETRDTDISRRALLGGALATSALAVPGAALARPRKPSRQATRKARNYREKNRVDLHCHYLAPAYYDALKAAGINLIGGIPVPQWTPDRPEVHERLRHRLPAALGLRPGGGLRPRRAGPGQGLQ